MTEPKLRFKREDRMEYPEWEELTMDDIFTEINEKDRADLPVLSILQGQGTVYRDSSDRNIMYDKKSTINYKAMKKGDFIIHLRTFEGGLECATLDGISSPAYKILRTNKLIPEAYKGYFRSKQFIDGRLAIAVTGVRDGKNIEMSTFWQITVPVPCLEEQQKIADFFSAIDEVIAQSEAEAQNLEQQKKAAMQKIFSQEVRFKREDGTEFPEWESYKIGDLFYKVNERNNGQFDKTKWISVAKMYYQIPDKVTSNNIDTRTYVMRLGDMAFEGHPNSEFLFGRFVVNDIGDGVISELFPVYRHKTDYVLKYWKYAIQIESVMAHIYRRSITSSGASSNKLNDDDFLNESILVPCLEEQQKIADFLSAYDETIGYAKQELDKWKELKKGLLQKMFV